MEIYKNVTFLFFIFSVFCFQLKSDDEIYLDDADLKKVSFYQGFLIYNDNLKNADAIFDLDQVIEGMKAAHQQSDILEEQNEKFRDSIKKYQEYCLNRMQIERLAEANHFLEQIAKEKEVIEVVPKKLYIKINAQGQGPAVQESDSPLLLYTLKTLEKGKEQVDDQIEVPKEVLLRHTHQGFLLGVKGMKEGEKRTLYIHPDLAFGPIFGLMKPNSLIIFEVQIIKVKT